MSDRPAEAEHRARVATIRAHLPTFVRLRQAALRDYATLTGWTLPESWDPGPDPDNDEATDAEARILRCPVTFAGTLIVAHRDDGTEQSADPSNPDPPREGIGNVRGNDWWPRT